MKKKILFTFLVLIMCLPVFLANASDFIVTDLSLPGGVIESDHGSIEITFSAPVDATTKDEIKLLKADGGEIPGGSYVTLSPDSMKAVLVYGRLYEGEYKLIGTERLLSEDGESLTPFEITYIVPVSVPEVKVYEANFETLNTGSISASNISAQVPGTSCGTGGGNAAYFIGETESGIKYLSVKTNKKNTGASLTVTLPEAIGRGKVYVDMRMKVTEGPLTRNMFHFADGNGSSTALRLVQYINTDQGIRNDGAGIGCDVLKKMPDKDDEGFFNLRLCMERNTTEDKWTAVCYDMNSSDRDVVFKSRQPFNNISSIQKITVLEIYPTSDIEAEEAVYVSDIKVSTHAEPELLYIEGDFSPDAEKIKTVLTEDTDMIDAEFYTRDGEKFDAEITLSEDKRTVFVTPFNYMSYGAQYILEFSGGIAPAIFMARPYPAEVVSLEAIGESLNYEIRTSKPNSSYVLFIRGYRMDGQETGIVRTEILADASPTGSTDVSALSDADLFKVYIWEKLNSSYLPIGLPRNVVRNQ